MEYLKSLFAGTNLLLFVVGVICLFLGPLGILLGIILFIVSFYFSKLEQKEENKITQKRINTENTHNENIGFLLNEFKINLTKDPTAIETEEIFNELNKIVYNINIEKNEIFKSFKIRNDNDFYNCLTKHKNLLEKSYEEDRLFLNDLINFQSKPYNTDLTNNEFNLFKLMFSKIENYSKICKLLECEPIPELVEDFKKEIKRIREQKQKELKRKKLEDNKILEKLNFVENILKNYKRTNLNKDEIEKQILNEYYEKYEGNITMRRIRGVWKVKIDGKTKNIN